MGTFLCAQEYFEFKGCVSISDDEPNSCGQVFELNGELYLSGNYFDQSIGRWTGYVAEIDNNGSIINLITEKVDTVLGFQVRNKVLSKNDSIFTMGSGPGYRGLMSFDHKASKVDISYKFNYQNLGVFIGDVAVDFDNQNFILAGSTPEESGRSIKVISTGESNLSYTDIDANRSSIAYHLRKTLDGNYVLVCQDVITEDGENSFSMYLIFLDDELNEISNTKDNMIDFQIGRGFLVDSFNNIICTGFKKSIQDGQEVFQTRIVKFDSSGNLLWNKPIDFNYGNETGWGMWHNVICSNENDGYILVGSENKYFPSHPDSIKSSASIAKIGLDGDIQWKKNYAFRDTSKRVVEAFNDIVSTSDGGYFLGGQTHDFSNEEILPWIKSIYLKVDNNGDAVLITSTINENFEENFFKIYPNPAHNYVTLDFIEVSSGSVSIYDIGGRQIINKEFNSSKVEIISIEDFSSGIYIIRVLDEKAREYKGNFIKR